MAAGRERAADPVEHAAPRGMAGALRQIVELRRRQMRGERLGERHRVAAEILVHAGEIYCALMPASRMIFVQRTTSDAMRALASSGVPPTGSKPSPLYFATRSGARSTLLVTALSFAIASFGVPAGAASPYQPTTS